MALQTLQRTRLATVAILVLVFGTGVLMGLVLDRSLNAAPVSEEKVVDGGKETAEEEAPRRYGFELVGLTPEQRAIVDSIVVEHRASMSALRKQFSDEYDPQYRAIVEATRESIKKVMTPDQATMYDSIMSERDRARAEEEAAGSN